MLHFPEKIFLGIKNGQPDASAARRNTAGNTIILRKEEEDQESLKS